MTARRTGHDADPVFVVQHHLATADHYDLRLEVDGVLASWAVPKGPSTDPADRRMARPSGDHALGHATFEGVVDGRRGPSPVQVWDIGTYRNCTTRQGLEVSMAEGLAAGHVSVELHGEKLTGGWALTRISTGRDEAWLLVKKADASADPAHQPVREHPRSVLSGRTIEEILEAGRVTPPG